MSDGTGYPYGATGYDPETGQYSWDPVPEEAPAEQPAGNGEDSDDEESGDDDA